jgi:hypothetical protein
MLIVQDHKLEYKVNKQKANFLGPLRNSVIYAFSIKGTAPWKSCNQV